MFCISVSFKKTPLQVRQKFAFSEEEQERFLAELTGNGKKNKGIFSGLWK